MKVHRKIIHFCFSRFLPPMLLVFGVTPNALICINGLQNQLNALNVHCIKHGFNDPAHTEL